MKSVFLITSGSVKEQFEGYYIMKGLGNMINPHDIMYREPSRATVKAFTDVKVMEISTETIFQLFKSYPQFKKKWFKTVFLYCIKMTKAADFL